MYQHRTRNGPVPPHFLPGVAPGRAWTTGRDGARLAPMRRLGLAIALVAITSLMFLGMLALYAVGTAGDGDVDEIPPWYLDVDDRSWQMELAAGGDAELGRAAGHPVRLCGTSMEQAYLASLLCDGESGAPPFADPFAAASAPRETVAGRWLGRPVDRYRVPCPSGPVDLYLSPYACDGGATMEAAAGFSPRFE